MQKFFSTKSKIFITAFLGIFLFANAVFASTFFSPNQTLDPVASQEI